MLPEPEPPCEIIMNHLILSYKGHTRPQWTVSKEHTAVLKTPWIWASLTVILVLPFSCTFPPIWIEWSQISTAMSFLLQEEFQRNGSKQCVLSKLQSWKLKQLPWYLNASFLSEWPNHVPMSKKLCCGKNKCYLILRFKLEQNIQIFIDNFSYTFTIVT